MEFIQNVSVFEEYTSFGEQKRIPELNKKFHPCGEAKGRKIAHFKAVLLRYYSIDFDAIFALHFKIQSLK